MCVVVRNTIRFRRQLRYGDDQYPLLWTIGATLGIYSAASISGGHLNPAVTLAFALVRPSAFPLRKVLPYWGAQTVGALLAGLTNLLLFHQAIVDWEQKHLPNNVIPSKCKVDGHFVFGAKSTQIRGCKVYDDLQLQGMSAFAGCWNVTDDDSRHRIAVSNEFHAIFIEAFGTAFVVFIIFSVTSPFYPIPGPAVPPVVALSLGAMLYLLGPLTGHHMNPASDIGRRLSGTLWLLVRQGVDVNSDLAQKLGRILQLMWMDCRAYLVGPMIGGPIGAWIADAIQPMY